MDLAGNLIDRAADVCLKEKRPLVLCTRETPLNRVHIRNMDWAAEAGATIFPLIPTFYNQPKSFEEMAQQFACRVLQFVGLEQKDAYRWGAEDSPRTSAGTRRKTKPKPRITRMHTNPERVPTTKTSFIRVHSRSIRG